MKKYYLVNSTDANVQQDVDISDLPVDGVGDVELEDVMDAAFEQLGWLFCEKTVEENGD